MPSIVCQKMSIRDPAYVAFSDELTERFKRAGLDGEFVCYLRSKRRYQKNSGRDVFSVLRKNTFNNMARVTFYCHATKTLYVYTIEWKIFSACVNCKAKPLRDHLLESK